LKAKSAGEIWHAQAERATQTESTEIRPRSATVYASLTLEHGLKPSDLKGNANWRECMARVPALQQYFQERERKSAKKNYQVEKPSACSICLSSRCQLKNQQQQQVPVKASDCVQHGLPIPDI